MGEEKGGERQNYSIQKDIPVAFQCGYSVCMHGQRDGVCPFPSTSCSEIGTFPWKISNTAFVPSFQEKKCIKHLVTDRAEA